MHAASRQYQALELTKSPILSASKLDPGTVI
jgi:hypothetical protein